ncbi:MAG: PD40 domain-containing protein [Acidobacteria bacterium]|nr:PD40 domain-containing protein [Acidobacteriota bacterium]
MAEPARNCSSVPISEPNVSQADARDEIVCAALERILASATFADCERLRALLRYLVEQELSGAGEAIKEYVIGTDALGKAESFDPKTDSVVRVQAGRLRAKLTLYYGSEGSADGLRISVPLRSYRPVFDRRAAPTPAERKKAPMLSWRFAAVTLAALVITGLAWRISSIRATVPGPQSWRKLTFDAGSTCCPAISRDGKLLVYASDRSGRGDYDIYVQSTGGGSPLRLTNHEERDYMPDLSPDGTRVAFASYRDGGGIYVVSVLGGDETRIIDDGDHPKFSPDGAWIAFERELPDTTFAIFAAPISGGAPRKLTPEGMIFARLPIWSPDGEYLLFVGASRDRPKEYDFWAVPFRGGEPIRTGVSAALQRQGLSAIQGFQRPLDWLGNHVLFAYWGGNGPAHLWKIPLSIRSWQVTGGAQQLTSGGGKETHGRVGGAAAGTHSLVFSSGDRPVHLWAIPMNSNRGVVTGPARQLTHDTSLRGGLDGARPSVSLDGNALVYVSRRRGMEDVWHQNLATGEEKALAASHMDERDPVLRRDGSGVAFARHEAGRLVILTALLEGGQPATVCGDCGSPSDWSADGQFILYTSAAGDLGLLDLKTGEHRKLPSTKPVLSASFSPDGRWIALAARIGGKLRGFLVPFRDGRWPAEPELVSLTNMEAPSFAWSPDGSLVYFLSSEEIYRCLFAQRIDLAAGRPSGQAFAIQHFHTVQGYPQMAREVAVARDKIVIRLTHERVNLWMMNVPD